VERRHLTLLLAGAALAGVALSPNLDGTLFGRHRPAPIEPPAPSIEDPDGLRLDARLDRGAVLQNGDGLRYLVLTVTTPAAEGARVPVDLALVVDTSASMGGEGKIEAARAAADAVVDALQPGDRFALVSFDDRARVVVQGQAYDGDAAALHHVIASLADDGGTNLGDGLATAHGELDAERPARKILLVSDGKANVGETEPGAFARLASGYASEGISVSAIGLGRDFDETLLEGVADAGGGAYHFVGNPEELPAVIAGELERTTTTVARRGSLHVHAAAGVHLRAVYGWTADLHGEDADIYVGDLSAGQSRKVVIAVDVPTGTVGAVAVADATLTYEPADAVAARTATAAAIARVTDVPADVDASVDATASVAATRARAGDLTRASADAWRSGDSARARSLLQHASGVIAETLENLDVPELRADQARAEELQGLDEAEGMSYAAKAASEAGRDLSR
jgi:Ca-activated chloride channel family protein